MMIIFAKKYRLYSLLSYAIYIVIMVFSTTLYAQQKPRESKAIKAESITQWKVADIQQTLSTVSDSIAVYNIWATWCKPCVEELPVFQQFYQSVLSSKKPIKLRMVSVDFVSDISKKLVPFLEKHSYTFPVVIINEADGNKYINLFDEAWEGSIPVTLVINEKSKKRAFHAGQLDAKGLEALIRKVE